MSPEVGVDDVPHVGEVPALLAVAIDDGRLAGEQRGREAADDAAVGGAGILARAEDVEVAQAERLQPEQAVEDAEVVLAGELLGRIGRERTRLHRLALGKRRCVAVDRGRAGIDEPPDARVAGGQEHREGGGAVRAVTAQGVGHRPGHAGDGSFVEHRLDASHRAPRGGRVGAVAAEDLDVCLHGGQVPAVAREEVVDHPHPVAAAHQRLHDVGPDEAGASCDQDAGHAATSGR